MVSRCPHSRCSHMFSRSSLRTLWSNWATKVARIFGVRMCAGSWLCPPSGESQPSNSWDRQRRWWVWVVLESAHPTRRSIRRLFRQYVFIGRTNTLSLVWKSRAFKGKRGGKFRLVEAVCFCGKDILLALPADVQKYAFSCPCATILSYFFPLQAGMFTSDNPSQMLIVLEPEAASVYCRRLRMHQLVPETGTTRPLQSSRRSTTDITMSPPAVTNLTVGALVSHKLKSYSNVSKCLISWAAYILHSLFHYIRK